MKKPVRMHKVIIRVLRDGQIQWVHFSTVTRNLYEKFLRATRSEPSDLNRYISEWCKQDFEVHLRMYKFEDIYHLKKAIIERYEAEYSELYTQHSRIFIKGWVSMWLSKHMKEEIVVCREIEKKRQEKNSG